MKIIELYNKLCQAIPQSLSCEWDCDGLEACPDPEREVCRVLISLDVTNETVQKAVEEKFDLIVAHHPLFFGGLDGINAVMPSGKRAVLLAKNDIAVMTFHTRLDALSGGVNDILAARIGLEDVRTVKNGEEQIMRVGSLKRELSLEAFARLVKSALTSGGQEPTVIVSSAGKAVKKVAVLGGAGGDDVALASNSGADTYLTGELKYHQELSADDFGINLVCAGHFFTEYPVCEFLRDIICQNIPEAYTEIYFSNKIETV